ncbi:YggT family protein [Allokutzneria albata]|uniref:YGGT family protein n=1 Tax=Allokutzneria albata TaxID=211114 RepID=A0A1H0AFK6_ALLAB|nr:YggT family protein [Allokutzneria albata]SDN32350.1 YGGT family protein [Allokutzneria albata]
MANHAQRRDAKAISGVLAQVVRWAGTLIAVLLVVHVVLTVGGANPDNAITRFVRAWADPLALAFRDLFPADRPETAVLVNYGAAAIFWLVVTSLVVKLLQRGSSPG